MSEGSHPVFLSKGDEIRIVSPASAAEKDYIRKTRKSLEDIGYKVSLGGKVFDAHHQFAGEDDTRKDDMQKAIDDKNVKAIFCARGGYGTIRIIDKLNFSAFKDSPKWIVGFSDITVFHSYLNCHLNVPSIHSPMPVNFDSHFFHENLARLNDLLQGRLHEIRSGSNSLNRTGTSAGKMVGGNLSILYSLQSTPYAIDTDDCILFIEDVGEQLYHLDRMMCNLRLSGLLKKLKGLIVGGLTGMKDKKRPFGKSAGEIVYNAVEDFNFPVCFGFQAGHIQNNVPFLLGADIELEVNENGSVFRYS